MPVISDNGVIRVAIEPLEAEHVGRVADAAHQSVGGLPPGYFPGANASASWLSEVTRAREDGIALALYVGASGGLAGSPVGAVIARIKPGANGLELLCGYSMWSPETTLEPLLQAARDAAAKLGMPLVRRTVRVAFDPV